MNKKIILVSFFLMLVLSLQASTKWTYSLEQAQKMAIATNKLILVDFWATWCGPCKRMDSESWRSDEIGDLANSYIPVRIDIDVYNEIAQRYNVRGIPYLFILDPNGEIVYQQMSYMNKMELGNLLEKFALNTAYLQRDMAIYYKKQNSVSSFRLAQAYQNYAIYLKEDIKSNFLSIASIYFNKTKQFLKSENKKNTAINQKIRLYEVQAVLIENNYQKCLKILKKKFKESNIEAANKKLYYFLNYVASKGLQDKQSDLWLTKLKTTENYQLYLQRATKILQHT